MKVVCKFKCQEVTKSLGYGNKLLYTARMFPVTQGSEENLKFFEATPSGRLDVAQYKEDLFEPGKEYFITVSDGAT